MRVVIISKSDTTGGAAVVSRRLMDAIRSEGVDARMLVVEKLSDSPYVETVDMPMRYKYAFLRERLGIYLHNGLDRGDLFKVDTADCGLPLWRHPLVKRADVVCLGWVNQGVLSLSGISRIKAPVVWVMHDMWNLTGICHHSYECRRYKEECGLCQYLHGVGKEHDLSCKVQRRKASLYSRKRIHFVAVSNWLAGKAKESSLLRDGDVAVINNPFLPAAEVAAECKPLGRYADKLRILFGAARLDDPVKGFPILLAVMESLNVSYPDLAGRVELVLFGDIRDASLLDRIVLEHRYLGRVSPSELRGIYERSDIVLSTSLYETLPGTLVEGQAYGCVPVCMRRGGQPDIIDHLSTGYMAEYSDDIAECGSRIAEGIAWAAQALGPELKERMRKSVDDRFSPGVIARKYIELFQKIRP